MREWVCHETLGPINPYRQPATRRFSATLDDAGHDKRVSGVRGGATRLEKPVCDTH